MHASQNESDRICPQPIVIPTDKPEDEVWHHIEQLTSLSYARSLLRSRIDNNFFKFGEHIEAIKRRKQQYNDSQDNQNEHAYTYEILSTDCNLEQNATEITLLTKQAIELYKASQLHSIYAKPILLYYSYINLARVLFLSTYQLVEAKGNHGISLGDTESITIQRNGAYQRFHDSYSWDPSIYLNTCKFNWRDLINERTGRYALVLNMSNCNAVYLHERESKNEQYLEHELTREIMFTHAMSMLARYKVQYWNRLIEGRKEDIIWKINEYLTSTQTLFPNLIYNQLHDDQYYFYPVEHELFQLPKGRPHRFPWLL
jgi:hypothetical protein